MKFTALLGMAAALVVGSTGIATGIASAQTPAAPAQLDSKKFNVIGTWNFLNINKKVEQPFWSEQLEDQDRFFQFLMDIGVRMGNRRKREGDTPAV